MKQNPADLDDWLSDLNPQSKVVIPSAYAAAHLREAAIGDRFQFERLGKYQYPSLHPNSSDTAGFMMLVSSWCWMDCSKVVFVTALCNQSLLVLV